MHQRGNEVQADKCWKKSAFGDPYYRYAATLAGNPLVKKHGPDRRPLTLMYGLAAG